MKPRITRSPKRVRISDIDVRESREETPKELPKKVETKDSQKVESKKSQKVEIKDSQKMIPKKIIPKVESKSVELKKVKRNTQRSKKRSKNRTISIKNKKLNEKDIKNVSQRMRQIRNTNKDEIKKELEKQGVKVTGKSDRLLKDIYLYSKVCNINITHEK